MSSDKAREKELRRIKKEREKREAEEARKERGYTAYGGRQVSPQADCYDDDGSRNINYD